MTTMFGMNWSSREIPRELSAYNDQDWTRSRGLNITDLPNEFHGVNCSLCGKNLRPCKSHFDYAWTNNCNFGVPVVRFRDYSGHYYRIKVNEAPGYEYLNTEADRLKEVYPRNSPLGYYLCHECMVSYKWKKDRELQSYAAEKQGLVVRREFKSSSLFNPKTLERLAFESVWRFVIQSLGISSAIRHVSEKTKSESSMVKSLNKVTSDLIGWIDSVVPGTMKTYLCDLSLAEISKQEGSKTVQRVKMSLCKLFVYPEIQKLSMCLEPGKNGGGPKPELTHLRSLKYLQELKLVFKYAAKNEDFQILKKISTLTKLEITLGEDSDALAFFQCVSQLQLEKLTVHADTKIMHEYCLLAMLHKEPALLPRADIRILDHEEESSLTPLALSLAEFKLDCEVADLTIHGLVFVYAALRNCKILDLQKISDASYRFAVSKLFERQNLQLMYEEYTEKSFESETFKVLTEVLTSVSRLRIFGVGDVGSIAWPSKPIRSVTTLHIGAPNPSTFEKFFKSCGQQFWTTFPNVTTVMCQGVLLTCDEFTKGLCNVERLELVPPGIPATFQKQLSSVYRLKQLFSWCCLDKQAPILLRNNNRLKNVLLTCIHGLDKLSDIKKYLNRNISELHILQADSETTRVSLEDYLDIANFCSELRDSIFAVDVRDEQAMIPRRVSELKRIYEERKGCVSCMEAPAFSRCSLIEPPWPTGNVAAGSDKDEEKAVLANRFPDVNRFLQLTDPSKATLTIMGNIIPAGMEDEDNEDDWDYTDDDLGDDDDDDDLEPWDDELENAHPDVDDLDAWLNLE